MTEKEKMTFGFYPKKEGTKINYDSYFSNTTEQQNTSKRNKIDLQYLKTYLKVTSCDYSKYNNFTKLEQQEGKIEKELQKIKEEQLKKQQEQLYNRYKNVYISTEDIKELYKIVKEVEGIETSKEIETKINNYNEKHIKLLYLISKLDKQQQVVELENKITINDKRCKYGFCNEDSTFDDIKQTQEAGNEQYIGLVFGKRSKGEDVKNIYDLINANEEFKNAISVLETEQTKLLTEQIDQYKSSITDLENQLEGIQQRKNELLGF